MRTLILAVLALAPLSCFSQQRFDVVSIHLSRGEVKFERDGETVVTPTAIHMHDVTVSTCIKLAYQVQGVQIIAPDGTDQQHYDIDAKTDEPAGAATMRMMLQSMLSDRFGLSFHTATKNVEANVLTVAPQGLKMKPSPQQDAEPWHQNSAMGMIAKNFSLDDIARYMSDPLGTPLFDETGLPGRYDFTIDFRPYVDNAPDIHADPQAVLRTVFQGELGLKMARRRTTIETMVVDHVNPPTAN